MDRFSDAGSIPARSTVILSGIMTGRIGSGGALYPSGSKMKLHSYKMNVAFCVTFILLFYVDYDIITKGIAFL